MNDDDDLPVLTQVLRSGRIPHSPPAWPEDSTNLIAIGSSTSHASPAPPRTSDMPIVGDPMSASLAAAWPDTGALLSADTATNTPQVEFASAFPDTISPDLNPATTGSHTEPATSAAPAATVTLAESEPQLAIDLDALEDTLRANIIKDLQTRIDSVLTQSITENLEPLLQRNMAALADEVRDSIHATLHDVVRRAVAQEVSRLQARHLH